MGRPSLAFAVVALCAALAAGGAVAVPVPAVASAGPTRLAAPQPGAQQEPGTEQEPTADQVTAALARASALQDDATRQSRTVAQARSALAASAADASVALEAYGQAAHLRDDAAARADRLEAQLVQAQQEVDDQRAILVRWARQAYVDGESLVSSSPFLYTVLAGGSTDDAATNRTWLEHAGADQAQQAARLRAALDGAQAAADRARHASDVAEAAAAQATAALRARDAVLDGLRARLTDLEVLLAASRQAADQADARAGTLARAWGEAAARGTGATAAERVADGGTGGDADCPGGDVSGYPNGRLPLDALCPVRGGTGLLRADAAAAFARMSVAFQARFGVPICVSDAYRSYDEQVRVRAERGIWAADPGHSNHGWGTAVDLCGGVEQFVALPHGWLVLNAPLYGWFHPGWAQQNGSKPEPWHWEYGG